VPLKKSNCICSYKFLKQAPFLDAFLYNNPHNYYMKLKIYPYSNQGAAHMYTPAGMRVLTSMRGAKEFARTHEIVEGALVPARENAQLPGTECDSPHVKKIASMLEDRDFLFVKGMVSKILQNTDSRHACESAAAHISSLKDPEAMLLAAASLATLSAAAPEEQMFLFYMQKAPKTCGSDGKGLLLELGKLTRGSGAYFADSTLGATISKAVSLLCDQNALHTAQRLPKYASIFLEATQNPIHAAHNVVLITDVLLEHLRENPAVQKTTAPAPATQESSASTQLWL